MPGARVEAVSQSFYFLPFLVLLQHTYHPLERDPAIPQPKLYARVVHVIQLSPWGAARVHAVDQEVTRRERVFAQLKTLARVSLSPSSLNQRSRDDFFVSFQLSHLTLLRFRSERRINDVQRAPSKVIHRVETTREEEYT